MNEIKDNARLSFVLAQSIVAQLTEAGITHLVTSPGYRNSPLLLAANLQEGLTVVSAVDERGGAFLALGLAKGGAPAALLCTSGTAVANYFPAVMEAFHSHCPLVVLTADRPLELVGTGANQCTDQTKVFGAHVRFFAELASGPEALNHAPYVMGKAVALSRAPTPGPVHVNIRFREPFLPDAAGVESMRGKMPPARQWKFIPSASGPSKEQWLAVESLLQAARRPLVLVGAAGFTPKTLGRIFGLTERTGYPVLVENASGLPFQRGNHGGYIIRHLETQLNLMTSGLLDPPDLLVRIGPPLTGKALTQFLKKFPLPQIVFDESEESREPDLHPSIFVQGGLEGWLEAFGHSRLALVDTLWRESLLRKASELDERVTNHLHEGALTEWKFHHELEQKIAEDSLLFLGNSMPIRDFNSAFPPSAKNFSVHANRGLSGIDGLVASAAGLSLASGKDTHAILGDLSTLHDLPSLALLSAQRDQLKLTLWVMNNGGGEIFRVVPTAKTAGQSEWFTTPQNYDLAALAKAFHLPFLRVSTTAEWRDLPAEACGGAGVRIIEIIADRESNLATRQSFRPQE